MIATEQASAICRGLLPIADLTYVHSDRLSEAGFGAHIPLQQFFESFASDEEQRQDYRRYHIEIAKNYLGRPWPLSMFVRSASFFSSAYITALFEQRDRENGVRERDLSSRYSRGEGTWRLESHPCDRRRVRRMVEQRNEYEASYAAVKQAQTRAMARAVGAHATGLSAKYAGLEERGEFYVAAMELHAADLGFEIDATKSTRGIPIFSKEILDGWDLCWTIEDAGFLLGGHYSPELQLRSRNLSGPIDNARIEQYLTIRYALVIPGFYVSYLQFETLDAFEALIQAHLCVYACMAEAIADAVRIGLRPN
jgi:hypothetical protein